MTPQQFIDKWRKVELKERTASQSHFIDLCHLLGLDDPVTADGMGEWFTFEKGASKSGGGEGWADVWRKDCFAWEYKGKRKDLDAAFEQLRRYAIGLENPPLLIVSDMDTIRIHTNWTNTVQQVHVIRLEDLTDAAIRDKLKACFENPEILRPAKTRQKLTEEAAAQFAGIAERLRGRGHDGMAVAHFVQRLVFCMFAEDVNLLPNKMFQRMLEGCAAAPENFELHARTLFGAMRSGGMVGFEKVEWFNGGLFDDDAALALNGQDIKDLLAAAKLDWSDIDPSILGTLFERGLDPAKRSQLGAHYTDRDKIMQIVNPVIIEPLMAEWAGVKDVILKLVDQRRKAEAKIEKVRLEGDAAIKADLQSAKLGEEERRQQVTSFKSAATKADNEASRERDRFIERLRDFRVLDPACGSGNFLYLSLLALKDIEHRVSIECEQLGLPKRNVVVGPENVLGIELNPYAAELARASVWIGEIQWMRRNGYKVTSNPILRSLNNIECRDAVLNADGARADWPKADVVVGNPPFLGAKWMLDRLGTEYTNALRQAYPVSSGLDLVVYWFMQAAVALDGETKRVGFVATNMIRSEANIRGAHEAYNRAPIIEAWSDEPWVVDGADVRVSLIVLSKQWIGSAKLDGIIVPRITADLKAYAFDLRARQTLSENRRGAVRGFERGGSFDISREAAATMIKMPINPNGRMNSEVVKPFWTVPDIVGRPKEKWVVDFGDLSEQDAALFEAPYALVSKTVKVSRSENRETRTADKWWRFRRSGEGVREILQRSSEVIVTGLVTKHRVFRWMNQTAVPDTRVIVFGRSNWVQFGLLSSVFHEKWSLNTCQYHGVGNDPVYTPGDCFETFPFPEGLTPNIPAAEYAADPRAQKIAAAAARLNELRENWLNPADLVVRVPEVVPGYPDRILPKDAAAEAVLKKRTLTNLYNERPAWLEHAHAALDEAVAEAYGWGEDWRAGKLTEDEILARLFRLNQERAAAQA
jgi:type II restriction/modification system DNA methylase subunit YeeA